MARALGPVGVQQGRSTMEEHIRECLYVCPQCLYPCCSESSMVLHMQKKHKEDMHTTDVSQFAVSLENVVLRLKLDQQGSSQYRCLKCNTHIPSRHRLSRHICVGPRAEVTCKTLCPDGVGLTNWQTLAFLKRRYEYLCHTCGNAFNDRTTFQMHVQSHIKGVELKKHVCEKCPYTTNSRSYFNAHTKAQHGDHPRPRPHVCEQCGKAFFLRSVLTQHKQSIHIKDRIFQCTLCPKVFYRYQDRVRHLQTHSGQRPWLCGACGQGFKTKYNLKVHERVHSGEKPYTCGQCDAAFAQKNSLNVHMKKHKGGGDGSSSQTGSKETSTSVSRSYENTDDSPPTHMPVTSVPMERSQAESAEEAKNESAEAAACCEAPVKEEEVSVKTEDGQYGYPAYPQFTVFPSLPGPSCQDSSDSEP